MASGKVGSATEQSNKKSSSGFLSGLFSFSLYKKNQGWVARQATALVIISVVALGCYTLYQSFLTDLDPVWRFAIPWGITLLGAWLAFRLVNQAQFADFLISVEGEMTKVSWASHEELRRATIVVIMLMLVLGVILFVFDLFWYQVLYRLGILVI